MVMKHGIQLLDLVAAEKLEELLHGLTQATGVAAIITEVDGKPITAPHNFTTLCRRFCRSTAEGIRRCYDSDRYGGSESARHKKFVIYECFNAGLLDSASPIIVEGYHIANVLMGQVLEKPIQTATAIHRASAIGVRDIDGYIRALEEVPVMDREKLTKIAGLVEVVTRTVSELALQKYRSHRRSRQYLHKLVNSVSDCIMATDAHFAVTMINDPGAVMFGAEKREFMGRSILSLFSDASAIECFQEGLAEGADENRRFELTAVDFENNRFPVQLALSGIRSEGRTDGFVAVIRNVSEEKKIEKMKEDLVGMLTHDMGNPIISIQKALQLLVDRAIGELNVTQMEMLRLALGTGNQLLGMVTDFLDIYRSENGRFLLGKHPMDMESVLMRSIEQVQLFAMEKRIGINFVPCRDMREFMGDRTRILRTCVNLLDNAVKYSPEGGTIELSMKRISLDAKGVPRAIAGRLDQGVDYCLVSISDCGPGIPKAYQRDIFDKFFRIRSGDGPGEGRKGTGLGLAFCRLVVYAHNGWLWVRSPLPGRGGHRNKGCRFNFVLPLCR